MWRQVFDLCTMKAEDQDFTSSFELAPASPAADGAGGAALQGATEVAALALWFDTDFSAHRCREAPVKLSTSPLAPQTHWVQTLLPLREPVALAPGQALTGRLSMCRNLRKHRSLDISVEYTVRGGGAAAVSHACMYSMSVGESD